MRATQAVNSRSPMTIPAMTPPLRPPSSPGVVGGINGGVVVVLVDVGDVDSIVGGSVVGSSEMAKTLFHSYYHKWNVNLPNLTGSMDFKGKKNYNVCVFFERFFDIYISN